MKTNLKRNPRKCGSSSRATRRLAPAIIAMLGLLLMTGAAVAGEGWDFTVDAAAYAGNTYVGSDEYFITPVPAFSATRGAGATTWFVSLPLEGVGVSRRLASNGLTGSLAMNFGGSRDPREYMVLGYSVEHSDKIRALLEGSPEVTTPVVVEAKVQYPVPFGMLGASLGYHPTSVEYGRAGLADETRHGFLLALQYQSFVPITQRFAVGGSLGLELMDGDYAEAWYSVAQETKKLEVLDAGAGVRDAQAALFASYQVAANVNLSLYYQNMLLLGDAADSSYTVDERQQSFLLRTSYSF